MPHLIYKKAEGETDGVQADAEQAQEQVCFLRSERVSGFSPEFNIELRSAPAAGQEVQRRPEEAENAKLGLAAERAPAQGGLFEQEGGSKGRAGKEASRNNKDGGEEAGAQTSALPSPRSRANVQNRGGAFRQQNPLPSRRLQTRKRVSWQ